MSECPSRFELRQLVAADLPAVRAKNLRLHLESCERCANLVAVSQKTADTYFENEDQHLEKLKNQIEHSQDVVSVPRTWKRTAAISAVCALATAAAAWLFIIAGPSNTGSLSEDGKLPDHISFKSSVALETVAKRGETVFRVAPGAELRAADHLRFFVTADSPGFVSIFSVDATGELFPYYPQSDPEDNAKPLKLERAGRVPMEGGIVLDNSTGKEHFVLVYSKYPFDRSRIHRKLRNILQRTTALPPVIGDLRIEMLSINKRNKLCHLG